MGINAAIDGNAVIKVYYTKDGRAVGPGIVPLFILYCCRRVAMAVSSDQGQADSCFIRIAIDDELVGLLTTVCANVINAQGNIGGDKAR